MELHSPSIILHPVLSTSLSPCLLFFFFSFIALAWQSAQSKRGGVGGGGRDYGRGGVVEEKEGEECVACVAAD